MLATRSAYLHPLPNLAPPWPQHSALYPPTPRRTLHTLLTLYLWYSSTSAFTSCSCAVSTASLKPGWPGAMCGTGMGLPTAIISGALQKVKTTQNVRCDFTPALSMCELVRKQQISSGAGRW